MSYQPLKRQDNPYQYIIESEDYQGTYQLRIQKDLSQMQVSTSNDEEDVHFNINVKELAAIRDMINEAIEKGIIIVRES